MISPIQKIKYLFVDQINLFSLLYVCLLSRSLVKIWHFDALMPVHRPWLRFFQKIGLFRAQVHQIEYNIGMVKDHNGQSKLVQLSLDGLTICNMIEKDHFIDNPLIQLVATDWDKNKVILHLKRSISAMWLSGGTVHESKRIGLIDWVIRTQLHSGKEESALLIRRNKWFPYLQNYASTYNIRLVGYRFYGCALLSGMFRFFFRITGRAFHVFLNILKSRIKIIEDRRSSKSRKSDDPHHKTFGPTIAVKYMGGKFSFDRGKRSELFWLNGARISDQDILFYNVFPEKPIETDTLCKINERGIRLFGMGPGISVWKSSWGMYRVLSRKVIHIFLSYIRCLSKGYWISPFLVAMLSSLAWDFAYWYDFYKSNHVVVDVSAMKMTVGQVLALDSLKGISIAYQYSISNYYPMIGLTAGEDIQFLISRSFEKNWKHIKAPVNTYIETGFVYDGAVQAVQRSTDINRYRGQLHRNGAEFILCFFDEGSNSRWDVPATHEKSAHDYLFLLEWIMDDPTLGIVFKPKRAQDLFERIGSIHDRIQLALETGRCIFLLDDTSVGSTYPAEAALMADLSIGILAGSTAALEAQLAGVPAVLIDGDGFYDHPFYAWGQGRVVFDSWKSLSSAIKRYRADPERSSGFGDWTSGLKGLDPYRDGQAGLRISSYIRWVYEAIKQGKSKKIVLETATENYQRKWGAERISVGRHY